jgi:hypothetical protein
VSHNPNAPNGQDGWEDYLLAEADFIFSPEDEPEYCRTCGLELYGIGRPCPECDPEPDEDYE